MVTFLLGLCPILLFCRHVGRVVRAAGVRVLPWYAITALLWFAGGMIVGVIAAMLIMGDQLLRNPDAPVDPLVSLLSFVGGVLGGCVAIKLARRRARRAYEAAEAARLTADVPAAP